MLLSTLALSALTFDAPVFQEPITPRPIVAQQDADEQDARGEAHRYSGSSTSSEAFQKWFAGEEFVAPDGETKDLRPLVLPNGQVAHGGDVIVKGENGEFFIK
ncbi:hypothetical protein [Corynebacterium lowii]|uniref:Uncharacterized protein n=1 Tax=Corynebacterium lowii TaxID=1544413 RepID=A0A0N8W0J8_9CORY|nr:hypothetical protein [Corynebacterium lowii]KQB86898.1 hypothetical protein Clow_01109 [Corynebacterium lowii]MDP9851586.1 hypothetical protein [Corynebacterium lowii]